jgi:hypothetical protein
MQADTISYLVPGRNLLLHGRFVADGVPDLARTPGYSLFLAVTSLAGLPAAAVVNVLLSVFSVFLVWKLGRAVFGENRVALGAAWIFAFEPISIAYSVVLMSETLFLLLFLLSMERFTEFLRGRRLRTLAMAGLWLAAATFVRPVTYYLPVALALGLFLMLARETGIPPQQQRPVAGGRGLRWKAPAVLLLCVLPWLAAWQIRNWVETGYGGFSSIKEINLYFNAAADVTAHMEHKSHVDVRRELGYTEFTSASNGQVYLYQPYLARHPEQAGWSQGQRLAFMRSESVRVIRAHSGVYLLVCLAHLFKTGFDPGSGYIDSLLSLHPEASRNAAALAATRPARWGIVLAKTYPWQATEKVVFLLVLLALYLFAVRGVFRGRHNPCVWLLLGTSLYFLVVSVAALGPASDSRLRLPIMPVVCILAAAGFLRTKKIAR